MHTIQNTLLTLLIFSLLFIGCTPSLIQEKGIALTPTPQVSVLDKVIEKGIIRVGTTGDFSPFSYQSNGADTYQGIDIELAKDLAESLDVEVQFIKTTWPTLLSDLATDKFDIGMSGITIKLVRQRQALFSIPLLSSGKAAITRDENVEKYQTLAAINQAGVRVIVNPGGTNEAFARANFPKATIVENEDNLTIFQRIVDGEADLMVTDAIETLVQEQIHPELDAINPDAPFNFFEMGYLLPRDHTFKAYIDQWLNLRQKDGTYQNVFDTELYKIKQQAEEK